MVWSAVVGWSASSPHLSISTISIISIIFSKSPNWDGISADAKNLISQLLVLDPRRRLSVEQALKHPWIVGEKVPSSELDVALGKLRTFKQRRGYTIKQGVIRKRGGIIPRWQDRCFVLTPETLAYYVSEHSQTVRACLPACLLACVCTGVRARLVRWWVGGWVGG